jgi:hypothetical protein
MHALSGQQSTSLTGPSTIDTLVVIVSRGADQQAKPSVLLDGLDLVSGPVKIASTSLDAYVWGVAGQAGAMGDPFCATVQVPDGCQINSIIGLVGDAEEWTKSLQNRDWANLVEEGPLTQYGSVKLIWKDAENAPKPIIQKPKRVKPAKKQESKPSIPEHPVFELTDAFVEEPYSANISILADDPDDDDELTFQKVDGQNWVNVLPSGEVQGTPNDDDEGLAIITVRVTDQDGEAADAELRIKVIKLVKNRAPFWKAEMKSVSTSVKGPTSKNSLKTKGRSQKSRSASTKKGGRKR